MRHTGALGFFAAITLIAVAGLACGKYGPPVRSARPPAPAAVEATVTDDDEGDGSQ
jgi:hypothetical protein